MLPQHQVDADIYIQLCSADVGTLHSQRAALVLCLDGVEFGCFIHTLMQTSYSHIALLFCLLHVLAEVLHSTPGFTYFLGRSEREFETNPLN
jgi:hypothetical protein